MFSPYQDALPTLTAPHLLFFLHPYSPSRPILRWESSRNLHHATITFRTVAEARSALWDHSIKLSYADGRRLITLRVIRGDRVVNLSQYNAMLESLSDGPLSATIIAPQLQAPGVNDIAAPGSIILSPSAPPSPSENASPDATRVRSESEMAILEARSKKAKARMDKFNKEIAEKNLATSRKNLDLGAEDAVELANAGEELGTAEKEGNGKVTDKSRDQERIRGFAQVRSLPYPTWFLKLDHARLSVTRITINARPASFGFRCPCHRRRSRNRARTGVRHRRVQGS